MKRLEEGQIRFYGEKYHKFGDDPKSLSWNDKDTQDLRFRKITELFKYEEATDFSVHEVGCGLAHFKRYLEERGIKCDYSGSDIVPGFVEASRRKYPRCSFYLQNINVEYEHIPPEVQDRDYYTLSGTFNSKEDTDVKDWEAFIFRSIQNMFRMARKGISINFLTKYSDFYDARLYYADPKEMLDWCILNLSRFVSVSHDVPLYEFTVNVYKEEYMREIFQGYKKYFKGV
jgi:hypothetical protein